MNEKKEDCLYVKGMVFLEVFEDTITLNVLPSNGFVSSDGKKALGFPMNDAKDTVQLIALEKGSFTLKVDTKQIAVDSLLRMAESQKPVKWMFLEDLNSQSGGYDLKGYVYPAN